MEFIETFVWSKNEKIDLTKFGKIKELRPIEMHAKQDGAVNGKASILIVMVDASDNKYCAQMSMKTHNICMDEIIKKINERCKLKKDKKDA